MISKGVPKGQIHLLKMAGATVNNPLLEMATIFAHFVKASVMQRMYFFHVLVLRGPTYLHELVAVALCIVREASATSVVPPDIWLSGLGTNGILVDASGYQHPFCTSSNNWLFSLGSWQCRHVRTAWCRERRSTPVGSAS